MIQGFILLILMVITNFYTSVGKNLVNKRKDMASKYSATFPSNPSSNEYVHVNLQCRSFGHWWFCSLLDDYGTLSRCPLHKTCCVIVLFSFSLAER
jgi:hypothetical protein